MQSKYKSLGEHIRLVKVKNTDDSVKELLGINIDKFFMPSVANIVGTDLSKYQIVQKNQFACNRMHVGRDYRIPVAKSNSDAPFIVSPAYDVFEIIDESILLPDYLMLWFKRREFDRNAWFYTDADVRGGLHWKAFINMQLPIPSPEKQKELIEEYEAVENRIQLNKKLCATLEETAQTIYKHWFEDFEFPDENGKPYQSSGGEMVECKELGKEIPKGWRVGNVKGFCTEMKNGATPSRENLDYWNNRDIPWLKTGEIKNNIIIQAEEYISKLGHKNSSTKFLPVNTVLMAMYGANASDLAFLKFETTTNQACCGMICETYEKSCFLYYSLLNIQGFVKSLAIGGAQPNISKNIIEDIKIIIPNNDVINDCGFNVIIDKLESVTRQTQKLEELKDLLLGKMAVEV